MTKPLQDDIRFQIPVKISYKALEALIRKKMVGEDITTEENGEVTKYATILDIDLARSLREGYDLAVDVKFRTLTTLFKNTEGKIFLDVTLDFDAGSQRLSVKDYKFEMDSSNWLLSNSLEALAGTFFREKIKKKMNFDFTPLIQEQLSDINTKLEAAVVPLEGISISGFVSNFRVVQLLPGQSVLLAIVELQGQAVVEVDSLLGAM